jgi:hypothetical protein
MATNYVSQAPGSATAPTVSLYAWGVAGNLSVPSLQELTINNSNDVFTWTQLNEASKLQVATTATNSISTNVVVEELTFFGNASATASSAARLGLIGLSDAKTKCQFTITNFGTKTITGNCYITGLAPKISADQPVWVTPVTLTVSGGYTVT